MPTMPLQQQQAILAALPVDGTPAPQQQPYQLPGVVQPQPAPQGGTATQQAFSSVGVPNEAFAPGAAAQLPTDDRALDRVASAVEWQESGGNEKAVSPKGAAAGQGPMGISSALAADYKGDAADPDQNRAMGRGQLAKLHDKYGNWVDALAAYNWGPSNVDKWIAGGRKAALPKETQRYINDVQERAGLPGMLLVVQKRELPEEDRQHILNSLTPGESVPYQFPGLVHPAGTATPPMFSGATPFGGAGELPGGEFDDSSKEAAGAFVTGARRGIMEIGTGAAQAVMEQVAPDVAQHMTSTLNDFESQFDTLTTKHPIAEAIGRVAGTATALLGGAGMLGATTIGETLATTLPTWVRYGIGSGLVGAASFRKDDSSWLPRWAEGAADAVFGVLGVGLTKSLYAGVRYLADQNAVKDFTKLLQGVVGDFSASASKLKAGFVDNYQRVYGQAVTKYGLRSAMGQQFDGFDHAQLREALDGAAAASRKRGIAEVVQGVDAQVRRDLGIEDIEAKRKAYQMQVRQWERDIEKWKKDNVGKLAGYPKGVQDMAIREALARGTVTPPPVAPPPFVTPKVTPEQFAEADQRISRALGRAKNDPQATAQLGMMRSALEAAGVRAAGDSGVEAGAYLHRLREARAFFKDNIGPLRDQFGNKAISQIMHGGEKQLTTLDFANQFIKALRSNDVEKLGPLMRNLGPGAPAEAAKLVNWEMLEQVNKKGVGKDGLTAISKYIRDRSETLVQVLGRQKVEELKGVAAISQRLLADTPKQHAKLWAWGSHSFLGVLGMYRIIEGVMEGKGERVKEGVGLMALPFAVRGVFATTSKLQALPYMLPMLRRASRLKPDSAEMTQVLRQLELRLGLGGAVVGRSAQGTMQDQASAP